VKFIIYLLLLATFVIVTLIPGKLQGFSGLNITNAVLYVAALSLLANEMIGGAHFRRKTIGVAPAIMIAIAVLLSMLYAQFLGVYGGTLIDNLRSAKSFVLVPVLFFVLAYLLVDTREQGERFLMLLVVVLGLLNLASAIGAQFGIELYRSGGEQEDLEEGMTRLAGFTGNPNKTAYLTCILIAFQYYFYRFHGSTAIKFLMAILMIGGLVVVLLSGSRGGFLVLVIMIMGLAYKQRDLRVIYATAIAVPVVVGILFITGSPLLESAMDRVMSSLSSDAEDVTSGRDVIWMALLDDYGKDPLGVLFGYGYGVTKFMGTMAEPHNIYLKTLVEFGVIGLGMFLYFMISIFSKVTRRREVETDGLRASVLASGYVVAVAWFFTTLVGIVDIVWFIIGIALATMLAARKKSDPIVVKPVAKSRETFEQNGKSPLLRRKVKQ